MIRAGLRLRIFLFFALQGLGGTALVLGALWLGHTRAQTGEAANGFVVAGLVSAFGLIGLAAGIWLLFDENVAKPIEALSASLRARAHADLRGPLATDQARYLGDLAPAADALAQALAAQSTGNADRVRLETARMAEETARLTALLTEIPLAILLISADDRIVLYDGQAAEVLAQLGAPRLGAPMRDYFDPAALAEARRKAGKTGFEQRLTLRGATGAQTFSATFKPLADGGAMLIVDEETVTLTPQAARPLVFDFALLNRAASLSQDDTPLSALTFTVFDSETTGLLPHKDDVVQIGAVRVVNGRIVPGEAFDLLVDPGRPIPPASTAVHHVTDAMVRGQPDIAEAGRRFHAFARGSVIVAHNAPFDMAFLHRHAAAMGVAWDHPILDTVLLSAVLFGAAQTHTLDALSDRLEVTIPERLRHTALGDARATAEVLVRMLPMLQAQGLTTLGAVIAETRRHGRLLQDLN